MKKIFFLCFVFPALLFAEWDELFQGGGDPALTHHVNVITGNLQLAFEDYVAEGAIPISIVRTYSSAGHHERVHQKELNLQKLDKIWQPGPGWNFFPHLQLLVDPRAGACERLKVYVREPSGEIVPFIYESHDDKIITMKPEKNKGRGFGIISGRLNASNHRLEINYNRGVATLYLANGGKRTYKGDPKGFIDKIKGLFPNQAERSPRYYLLREEVSPSGQRTSFDYDEEEKRLLITQNNPSGTKVYSSVTIIESDDTAPFCVRIFDKGVRVVEYEGLSLKEQNYLSSIATSKGLTQNLHYVIMRKKQGAALRKIEMLEQEELFVEYYRPRDKEAASKLVKKPHQKPFKIDKVHTISQGGQLIATFSYIPGVTEVRDAHQILTRYHYEDDNLTLIEYFDENDHLYSSQMFFWREGYLIAKAMCNSDSKPLFSKTFSYNNYGDVIKETIYGNITGTSEGPFSFGRFGELIGADSYSRFYEYDPETHLLLKEIEQQGLTYHYSYLPGTDLVTKKTICDGDTVVAIEESFYDEDHLLIGEKSGNLEKHYRRDPKSGMITAIEENGQTTQYTYSPRRQIIKEERFDENGQFRYAIDYTYDKRGRLIKKTSPSGHENHYTYDSFNHLLTSKEVGSSEKSFLYDARHRPISCRQNQETAFTLYDPRGSIIKETTHLGHTTSHSYDAFNRRIETILPTVADTEGRTYSPTMQFTYDLLGHVTSCKNHKGDLQKTSYNLFGHPTRETFPDGSEITHLYQISGCLKETLHQDGSKTTYTYDIFQRITSKTTPLGTQRWVYSPEHLQSYTDETGVTTTYTYDKHGRKIAEETLGRKTTYTYDPLGYLESTDQQGLTSTQIHDEEGKIIEEHKNGENRTFYTYDEENRKSQIRKITSAGETIDLIEYDLKGRITHHIDPNGHATRFCYDAFTKTTIDPIGHLVIETFDALERLIQTEKKTPQGHLVFLEQLFYDPSGNLTRKLSHIYDKENLIKTNEIRWSYDFRGQVTHEYQIDRVTTYRYDTLGRLTTKTYPNQLTLNYSYDPAGRLSELTSSDQTIHYRYHYDLGINPTIIEDLIHETSLKRNYNPFGELISETNDQNLTLKWEYDDHGREKKLILPDHSQIAYEYNGPHISSVQRLSPQSDLLYEHTYDRFDSCGHVAEETLIGNLGKTLTYYDLLERAYQTTSPFYKASRTFGPTNLVTSTETSLTGKKNYTYDTLNQIKQENEITYHFDSLGNPLDFAIDDYNQLFDQFLYDTNGYPIKRLKDSLEYTYDALGRLTTLTSNNRKVEFVYDAYSRLSAKITTLNEKQIEKRLYLYDQEYEIGSMNTQGDILDLKLLGLGLENDIGSAIAIEIGHTPYAPLHDFQGNIIALISLDKEIIETYDATVFGQENLFAPLSPWRFSSKRNEENLIYFGKRFYDPTYGRWLTPDPLGFLESPNVYLYVCNSPLNRLDLFGLSSHPYITYHPEYTSPPQPSWRAYTPTTPKTLHCEAYLHTHPFGAPVDCIIISGSINQMRFNPVEQLFAFIGKGVNLLDHMDQLVPQAGTQIGLITLQNGINTTREEFTTQVESTAKSIPEGTTIIGLYNPSYGIWSDFWRALSEINGRKMTPNAIQTGLFFKVLSESRIAAEIQSYWLHIPHSEAGILFNLGHSRLPTAHKELLKNQLLVFAIAPAEPISRTHCYEANNIYSAKDRITGGYGKKYRNNPDYNIHFVKCDSPWREFSGWFADHSFTGTTYRKATRDDLNNLRNLYGFYDARKR